MIHRDTGRLSEALDCIDKAEGNLTASLGACPNPNPNRGQPHSLARFLPTTVARLRPTYPPSARSITSHVSMPQQHDHQSCGYISLPTLTMAHSLTTLTTLPTAHPHGLTLTASPGELHPRLAEVYRIKAEIHKLQAAFYTQNHYTVA